MRTSVWLVRHGQTELNRGRRYQGALDSPLTPYGLRQNAALGRRLQGIPLTLALVSPCQRARATANTILEQHKTPFPTIEASRWQGMRQGRWEGLTYRQVQEQFPEAARARWQDALHGRAQDGESLAEVARRTEAAWQDLLRDYPGERILLVTHALPIQLMLCLLNDTPIASHWRWRIDLGSVTGIGIYGTTPIIRMVNEVPPL